MQFLILLLLVFQSCASTPSSLSPGLNDSSSLTNQEQDLREPSPAQSHLLPTTFSTLESFETSEIAETHFLITPSSIAETGYLLNGPVRAIPKDWLYSTQEAYSRNSYDVLAAQSFTVDVFNEANVLVETIRYTIQNDYFGIYSHHFLSFDFYSYSEDLLVNVSTVNNGFPSDLGSPAFSKNYRYQANRLSAITLISPSVGLYQTQEYFYHPDDSYEVSHYRRDRFGSDVLQQVELYNPQGLLQGRKVVGGDGSLIWIYQATYSEDGRITQARDFHDNGEPHGSWRFTYDERNLLTQKSRIWQDGSLGPVFTYQYNERNQLIKEIRYNELEVLVGYTLFTGTNELSS